MTWRRTTILATAALACAATSAGAGTAPTAGGSPFKVSAHPGYKAVLPGEDLPVAVVLDIAPEHKVYDDSVTIEISPGAKGRIAAVARPPAAWKYDPATKLTTAVHTGRAIFKVTVATEKADGDSAGGREGIEVRLRVGFRGCVGKVCFLPETRDLALVVPVRAVRAEGEPPERINEELFEEAPVAPAGDDFTGRNPVVAILVAFGLGLLLAFTPCVYPLIPITVAVIGARSSEGGWRKGLALSLMYVLGISVTYAVLGAVAAKGGSSVGAASQHWAVATAVAVVFLALAASLFGVYDFEMPSSWQAKLRMRRAGGPVGIFAMGLLSGLVATPCVAAPLYAVLTFIATTGNVALGAAMLFAMAWGMSVLLILAGTFSGFTSRLPKAGGWMVAAKTALGVVVVLAALYFLRPVLPVWAFTAYLAAPLVAFGLWRGAWTRVAPDAARGRVALKAAGVTALVLGVYLGVGALVRAGVPTPVLSGLYPDRIVPSASKIKFQTDYDAALAEAADTKRPVMLDFVLPNCPGCRELEEDVFSREDVAQEASRFVRIRIDLAEPPPSLGDPKKTYRIFGAPAVVWIDRSGSILYDLTVADGGIGPDEFLRRMREIK